MKTHNRLLTVHMIGNAHIDPVWLWPWQAGVDEVLSTFRSAADRCDEYPEFIFTRGESWCYEWVERLDPQLFLRVRKLVERGQWHITGGQYLQPDCNLPTAMGFRQCIARGQQFFRDRFGIGPKVGLNVDSFGHAGTLPDIYGEFGYIGYCFQRPRPPQMPLPAQCFRWEGVNGGSLLAFRIIPLYVTRTDDLWGQITLAIEAADPDARHVMCFYGVGNHGGGPTKANIEYILEHRDAFPGARLEFSTPERFFECVKKQSLPVHRGEMQHCFPGCYSVMHDIKQDQFRNEHLLDRAEAFARQWGGKEAPSWAARLGVAWDDLLFTQFHDILAGTSSQRTWDSCRAMQGRARIAAEEAVVEISRKWALQNLPHENIQRLVVMNPLGKPFSGIVEAEPFIDFDVWGNRRIVDEKGRRVPFQQIQPDGNIRTLYRVAFPLDVPAGGSRVLRVEEGPRPRRPEAVKSDLSATRTGLTGRDLQLKFRSDGLRVQFGGTSFGSLALRLRPDPTDTWTMTTDSFADPLAEKFEGGAWEIEESGPIRVSARCEGMIGRSPTTLRIRLATNQPFFEVIIETVWCEEAKILCLECGLPARAGAWTAAVPGGHVERPAGQVEWPVQGWVAPHLPSGAMAIITPDAYSASMRGKSLEWTLLRSPQMAASGAKPKVHHGHKKTADLGFHRFTFLACYGRKADFGLYDRLLQQSLEPLIVFDEYLGMNRPPWKNSPPRTLWLAAEHRARKDGHMKHLVDDGGPGNIDDGGTHKKAGKSTSL